MQLAQNEKRKGCPQAILFAALAVLVGGCSSEFMQSVKSAATEMTTPAPVMGPYDPPQPSPWVAEKPPPPPPTPAPAAKPATAVVPAPTTAQHPVQQPPRVSEPKPAAVQPTPVVAITPTTVTTTPPGKGASKLMAPSDGNALQVNAREITPATTAQADTTSTTLATAPVGELIFKGPPHQYHSSSPTKWIVIGGLLILAAAGGGFAWFQMQQRAVFAKGAPSKKERPPEGFEMREPTNVPNAGDPPDPVGHGPDTVLDA
jgi:hypothetical protein